MSFVLDASVTMGWLLSDASARQRQYAAASLGALKQGAIAWVPATWTLEVANVLARAEARGQVTQAQIGAFLELLAGAPIRIDEETVDHALGGTLDLARRFAISSYDASYLELALRRQLPLATFDDDLHKAAERAGAARFRPT
ncbi:MAG: type II toxin-antitoxin system VapC family toxin [Steroidobacteraceae bacterium]|nr:type II toxin-antitoxin system VapC family toxin [Steroidobacteraceae bacterium]